MRVIVVAVCLIAACDVAAAQELLPATGWSGTITTSLLQGLLGVSATGGGIGSAVLYQLFRLAQAKRKTEEARSQQLGEANTSGIVRSVIEEAAGLAFANKQAKPGTSAIFKGKDLTEAKQHAADRLAEYGINIDSDVLRSRIRAKIGEVVVSRLAPPPAPAPLA